MAGPMNIVMDSRGRFVFVWHVAQHKLWQIWHNTDSKESLLLCKVAFHIDIFTSHTMKLCMPVFERQWQLPWQYGTRCTCTSCVWEEAVSVP